MKLKTNSRFITKKKTKMLNESCLIIKDDIIKIKLVEYVPYVTLTVIAALFGLIGSL